MESAKGSFVEGGVKISHAFLYGEHRYTVVGVRTHSGRGGAEFARKGDMLTCINGTSLADIPPDELAHLLTDGNPKLTVHKAAREKEASEHCNLEKDALHPFKKESGVLCFSMEMRREEDLGEGECGIGRGGGGEEAEEGGRGEAAEGPAEEEANGEGEGEGCGVLVVKLTNASLSVVKGRGCAAGCPTLECQGTGCTFNEVVLVANSSTVTQGNTAMFMRDKEQTNINLENIHSETYLRDLCEDNLLFASANPTEMTIYSYKSTVTNETFRGVPVVLNFTKSESFLKCIKQANGAILRAEACDKQRLRLICKQDESALAFLFYMKGTMSGQHQFESALCEGWFIQVLDKEKVLMANPPVPTNEPSFYFIIVK